MSEEKKTERHDDVVVQEDGKATVSQDAADRALDKQAADPNVKTTSEPAADSPAQEQAEQQAGTSEMAGVAATADAGTEAGKVEGAKGIKDTADESSKPAKEAEVSAQAAEKPAAEPAVAKDKKPDDGATGEAASKKPASDAAATDADAEKEAKRKAAAEARAARAAARAKKEESAEEAAPKEPSPNQPKLDRLVAILKEQAGDAAVEAAWINEQDHHRPVVEIAAEHWPACARAMKDHPELKLHFLRNVSGVDRETHMEVVYHLLSFEFKQDYCVKVKTDRDAPQIPSITPVWTTADWQEREIYDLLGIDFPGHPDLRRIMLPDDWVGHPLRKDYEPLDPEV